MVFVGTSFQTSRLNRFHVPLRASLFAVIGETATVGNDVSILHGVTLGGTGKELGDRHPKVQHGVILKDCSTVLGNIPVGTGAVVMAKAIVNKPVPPLAIMSGVPAKAVQTRTLSREAFSDDLEEHLAFKYLEEWKELQQKQQEAEDSAPTMKSGKQ